MVRKQLELLAALVEDAKAGSDAVIFKHIRDEVNLLVNETWASLRKAGNECSRYEKELNK